MRRRRAYRSIDVEALLSWLEIASVQRGEERWACCPLHQEKEPSFQIRDAADGEGSGLWRCYGCSEHGNAEQLVARLFGVSIQEAIAMMRERGLLGEPPPTPARVVIESDAPAQRGSFTLPAGVEFEELAKWVTPARRYAESRGITAEQVDRWGIGVGAFGKLVGRIVIPVRDGAGIVRGYSARTFIDDEQRYLEPSTADGYVAGYVWGEEHWPALAERDAVVVCEGSLNGLAAERLLAEIGAPQVAVAAVRGSELMPGHAIRLGTFRRVIVASDPDKAGEKLWSQCRSTFGKWARVQRLYLRQGCDVNEMERKHRARICAKLADVLQTGDRSPKLEVY